MKKIFSTFLFSTLLMFSSFCQEIKKPVNDEDLNEDVKHIIKFSPVGLLPVEGFGYPLMSYEFSISSKQSLQINTTFNYYSNEGSYTNNIGIGAEYRKYFSTKKTTGVSSYVGFGFGSNVYNSNTYDGSDEKTSSINAKIVLGRQWYYENGFVFDINAGPEAVGPDFKVNTVPNSDHAMGVIPAIYIGLGYNFK